MANFPKLPCWYFSQKHQLQNFGVFDTRNVQTNQIHSPLPMIGVFA